MRLLELQSDGRLILTGDLHDKIPEYAILSHTWGADGEELTFKDLIDNVGTQKAQKIRFCGEQAARDGLKYFWVDTCCIDKSNSTELGEAINSMFRWYRDAAKCYVYLSDVSINKAVDVSRIEDARQSWESAFRHSRWFTRGWTLQELLAPDSVEFFSVEGLRLGDRISLEQQIHETTGIPIEALRRTTPLSSFSVDERMSWAANRNTKRKEDEAYCLLGIFNIYMPFIYGEGENAIVRLRRKISKSLPDLQAKQEAHGFSTQSDSSVDSLATWLQPATVAEDLTELLKRHHPGTCSWIYNTPEFKSWESGRYQHLWIYGKPGSGKSVLAATTIKQLQMRKSVVAYFFCLSGDDSRQTLESILGTWLWQILDQMPQFLSLAHKNRSKSPGTQGQLALVKGTLEEIISKYDQPIYLVVDGLDECGSAAKNLDKLAEFMMRIRHGAHVIIISRAEDWIRNAIFPRVEAKCCLIQITNLATYQDLSRWITDSILAQKFSDPVFERLAISTLERNANGMFLWARLQLTELESQLTIVDAKSVLQNELPMGLESIYERLLMKIERTPNKLRRNRSFSILQWITAAVRPLTIRELKAAISTRVDSPVRSPEAVFAHGALDVLEACAGFVEIMSSGHVRFIHSSAREFLRAKGIQFGLGHSVPKSELERALDAMHIARACMTSLSYLETDTFQQLSNSTDDTLASRLQYFLDDNPFLIYATINWWKHLDGLPFIQEDLLRGTITRFLASSQKVVIWLQLYQYLTQFHPLQDELSHPCTTSGWPYIKHLWDAHLGPNSSNLFDRWHRWHIEMMFDPGVLWPTIHIAAFFDFADVVESQLQHGVSANLSNDIQFTPLLQAAHGDSFDTVRVLINHGANLRARTENNYSAIRYASRNSLKTLVQLIQAGCPPEVPDTDLGQIPLHEVCSSVLWHPRILQTLLDVPDISNMINVQNWHGNTPLDTALAINVSHAAANFPQSPLSLVHFHSWELVSHFFHAGNPEALAILHEGWEELGSSIPMPANLGRSSLYKLFLAWKYKIIEMLTEKGAICASDASDASSDLSE